MGTQVSSTQYTQPSAPVAIEAAQVGSPTADIAKQTLSVSVTQPVKPKTYFVTKLALATGAFALLAYYLNQSHQSIVSEAKNFGDLRNALDNEQYDQARNIAKTLKIGQRQAVSMDNFFDSYSPQHIKVYAEDLSDPGAKSVAYGKAVSNNPDERESLDWINPTNIPDQFVRDQVLAEFVRDTNDIALKKEAIKRLSTASLQITLVKETYEKLFPENVNAAFEILSMMSLSTVKFETLSAFAKECPHRLKLDVVHLMKNIVADLPHLAPSYSLSVQELIKEVLNQNNQLAYDLTLLIGLPEIREETFFYLATHSLNLEIRELAIDHLPIWAQPSLYSSLCEQHEKENRPQEAVRIKAKIPISSENFAQGILLSTYLLGIMLLCRDNKADKQRYENFTVA